MSATGEFFEGIPKVSELLEQAAQVLAHPAVERSVDTSALFPGSEHHFGIKLPADLKTSI